MNALSVIPIAGFTEVLHGTDLAPMLVSAMAAQGESLRDGDALVLSSKVVSKALGLRVPLDDQSPSATGEKEAEVLARSVRVVAERRGPAGITRVVESEAGPVMAAAGIDASNTGPEGGLLTLPADPDLAARDIYAGLLRAVAPDPLPLVGVVLTDTSGRPWRAGQTDIAIGACGVAILDDLRGGTDADGRELSATSRALADEIAAAADLVKGKSEGVPAAIVRGLPSGTVGPPVFPGARTLVRSGPGDWFSFGSYEAVRAALGVEPGTAAAEELGIPDMAPEDESLRLDRAITLALRGQPGGSIHVHRDSEASTLSVSGADLVALGYVAARLEVALRGERLTNWHVTPKP